MHPPLPALFAFILCASLRCWADETTAPELRAPAANQRQPLCDSAARFIGYLASDIDQQAEHGAKIVEALIAAGWLEEGQKIARLISDYRQPVSLYRLAEEAARRGESPLSQACFAEAAAGEQGARDFQREAISNARIGALAARGDVNLARKELGNLLSKVARAETEARLFEFDRDPTVTERAVTFAEKKSVAPNIRGRALLLAAESERQAGRHNQALALTQRAVEVLCTAADVETIPQLRTAVRLFAKLEARADASRWAGVCLGFAERTDKRAYWKTRDMRLAAESLLDAGEQEKADALFKQIPNLPAALDPFTYSRGAVEAAQAYLLTERKSLFHEVAAHVLRMTRKHPHYRARAMGALDVLGVYLRNQQTPPEKVFLELEESAQAIERDPHFLNPA